MPGGTSPRAGVPYPGGTSPTNVPGDLEAAIDGFDAVVALIYPVSALPTDGFVFGRVLRRTSDGTWYFDNGGGLDAIPILDTRGSDITDSAPGDDAAAGTTGRAADAGHRHGRETYAEDLQGTAELTTYTEHLTTIASSGSSKALDLATARAFRVTLTGNCAFTFSDVPSASGIRISVLLALVQDSTGGRTPTFPGNVDWGAYGEPAFSTAPGAVDTVAFISDDNGSHWQGYSAGLGFAH